MSLSNMTLLQSKHENVIAGKAKANQNLEDLLTEPTHILLHIKSK